MTTVRSGVVALLLGMLALQTSCRVPPEDELEAAQKQVEGARKSEAGLYAPELMREAEDLLLEASAKVAERSYPEARSLADEARAKAAEAEKVALGNRTALREKSSALLSEYSRRMEDLRFRTEALPRLSRKQSVVVSGLAQQLSEAEKLLQVYKDNVATEHYSEAQTMQEALQARLQQLATDLDSSSAPDAPTARGVR